MLNAKDKLAERKVRKDPKKQKRAWILGGVGLAVAVLSIVIIVVAINSGNNEEGGSCGSNNDGSDEDISVMIETMCGSIIEEYRSGGITLDEASEKFEVNIDTAIGVEKVFFSMCYANFVYDEVGDPTAAALAMSGVEQNLEEASDYTKVSFYALNRYFYRQSGNEGMAAYYDEKVGQYIIDGTMMEEE